MNQIKKLIGIYLRGISMGAADVVPGVSGGTIAFISGIYQELLDTIKGFNFSALKFLKQNGIKATWEHLNLTFLITLVAGIFTSIVSLAGIIKKILDEEGETASKIGLWSFFFGLIVASVIYVGKKITSWNIKNIIGIVLGAIVAYYITTFGKGEDQSNLLYIVFAGSIAICAMILPGISGSFILLLMGAYEYIVSALANIGKALSDGNFVLLSESLTIAGAFGTGAIIGLLSFSRVLSWLFKHQEQITLATLTGFMVGSLNKIWPWKKAVEFRPNSKGEQVPFRYQNLSISDYEQLNFDPHIGLAVGSAIIGFIVVFGLEFLGQKMEKKEA